jgi:hypothetical protein
MFLLLLQAFASLSFQSHSRAYLVLVEHLRTDLHPILFFFSFFCALTYLLL